MVINGKEIDFKISRKSDSECLDRALKKMQEKEKEIQKIDTKNGGLTEVLEALRNMFVDFFEEIAKGVDVIGECDDLEEITEIFFTFLKDVNKQGTAFIKSFSIQRIK